MIVFSPYILGNVATIFSFKFFWSNITKQYDCILSSLLSASSSSSSSLNSLIQ